MDRKKHIDNRNLVICETFDEFAEKVGQLDFNVEDIVGYVTSICRTFYWLDVESVWGVLGFNWTPPLENLEEDIYLEENIEHVESDGTIIDYDNKSANWKLKHALKKGYGAFSHTTMPFSIVPTLPDGYRITGFVNTFDNIASDVIEVKNSDWHNFHIIDNLVPPNKSMIIDLTGSDITTVNNYIFQSHTGKLYIKADFSKVQTVKMEYGSSGSHYKEDRSWLIVDDDNKYLNLPKISRDWDSLSVLYYKGTGPLRIEYFFKEVYPTTDNNSIFQLSVSPMLYSENGQYNITVDVNNNYYIIARRPFTEVTTIPEREEQGLDITFNTELNGDVLLSKYFTTNNSTVTGTKYYNYKVNSINFEGQLNSIDWYFPYACIYDEYPQYKSDVVSKMIDTEDMKFMPYLYLEKPMKCPYTLDLQNRKYLSLFENMKQIKTFNIEDIDTSYLMDLTPDRPVDRKGWVYDIFPELINSSQEFESVKFPYGGMIYGGYSYPFILYKVPNIKAKHITLNGFYIGENTTIETSDFNSGILSYATCGIYDSTYPHIKLYASEDGIGYSHNDYGSLTLNKTDINFIRFVDIIPDEHGEISNADKEKLKKKPISVGGGNEWFRPAAGYSYLQPFVKTNGGKSNPNPQNAEGRVNINWDRNSLSFNPLFIFIYRHSIVFDNEVLNVFTNEVVLRVIHHIEPLDDPEDYGKFDVSLHSQVFNRFSDTEQNNIRSFIASIHYTLTITNN